MKELIASLSEKVEALHDPSHQKSTSLPIVTAVLDPSMVTFRSKSESEHQSCISLASNHQRGCSQGKTCKVSNVSCNREKNYSGKSGQDTCSNIIQTTERIKSSLDAI